MTEIVNNYWWLDKPIDLKNEADLRLAASEMELDWEQFQANLNENNLDKNDVIQAIVRAKFKVYPGNTQYFSDFLKREQKFAEDNKLPYFRFYPAAYSEEHGAFERTEAICPCCQKSRGWGYLGTIDFKDDNSQNVCPFCIHDGLAYEKYKKELQWNTGFPGVDKNDVDELNQRTPDIFTWQDYCWSSIDGKMCQFVMYPSFEDLKMLPGKVILDMWHESGAAHNEDDLDEMIDYIDWIARSSAHRGYLFKVPDEFKFELLEDLN
jgi:uncharacterized protein